MAHPGLHGRAKVIHECDVGACHLAPAPGRPAEHHLVTEAHGLAPHASAREVLGEYHRADLRLIQTSEAFDFPITPPPANVRYVGPVLDEPDWVEAWQSPWAEDDPRPLVVVGLSSTFQGQRDALQRIVTALGTLDVRGMSAGQAGAGSVAGAQGASVLGSASIAKIGAGA